MANLGTSLFLRQAKKKHLPPPNLTIIVPTQLYGPDTYGKPWNRHFLPRLVASGPKISEFLGRTPKRAFLAPFWPK